MTIDPIEQFKLENLFKIGQIGDHAIYFTSSSAYMLLAVVLTSVLMIAGVSGKQQPARRKQTKTKTRQCDQVPVSHVNPHDLQMCPSRARCEPI